MRRVAAFREYLKERLEDTRPAEPPEPLPYAVPVAKFTGQRSPGNTVDREIVDCLQEFSVVISRLSPVRLHCVERFKCDHPIPLRHSCQHVRLRECRSRSDSNKLRFENPSEMHVRDSVHTT